MNPKVLYVSYDGVLEPLGESQVIAYVERLANSTATTVLSFEKNADLINRPRVAALERRLAEKHVAWIRLKYHKRPPVLSTALDVIAGTRRARQICHQQGIDIVHARGYVPALIALGARRGSNAAFLFDTRGFWVDEKVEAGHWKRGGLLYRVAKWCERRFYREADAVVSLTSAGARAIPELGVTTKRGIRIEVIPTCADLRRFSPAPKDQQLLRELKLENSIVIGSIGTMHNWYMRTEMIACLAALVRGNERVKILLVTRDDANALKRELHAAGVPRDRLVIVRADFTDMPRYVRLFDAGLFFIRPTFAKRASAATKLAEFLACGVPVIINDGVGDSGAIVREKNVGLVLAKLDAETFEAAPSMVRSMIADPAISARCRTVASDFFDVESGVARYRDLYFQMSTNRFQG